MMFRKLVSSLFCVAGVVWAVNAVFNGFDTETMIVAALAFIAGEIIKIG